MNMSDMTARCVTLSTEHLATTTTISTALMTTTNSRQS